MSEHDGERTREEAEQEIALLAERIVGLLREREALVKALEEIAKGGEIGRGIAAEALRALSGDEGK